jgi:putative selenate reductase
MAELVPVPLPLLLRRAFLEYEREGKIFDLPKSKFFRGFHGLDTSVHFHGHPASNPVGPAAGPHDQLVQNIVLSWLAGSRIIELKTVQILDELKIPRPCIDMTNVGYNVEWSQELKLDQSLREYVGAAMFIEILKASKLLGEDFCPGATDTIFDMSVGYSLEGIRSARVRGWIEAMKDASAIVDELRGGLEGAWARYRDLPFPTRISDTITLSTFHGCPAEEIEGIVSFLLTEMDVHVCIKLNPTLLGQEMVEHLLHEVMGYNEIQVTAEAFAKDLQFGQAMEIIPRLDRLARSRGKRLAVKCSNTLVVKNRGAFFSDDVMYMSGPPLHVVTMNLVKKLRERLGARIPISFSAGVDAHNFANMVAMNFVPITTCTDLLRPGGYGRLIRYLDNLGAKMQALGVRRIPDFVVRYAGKAEAAIEHVIRGWIEAVASVTPGTTATSGRAEKFFSDTAPARLKHWLATPETSLASVCEALARDFEEGVVAGLPPLVAGALRARMAGLEQELVETAGLLNTPGLVHQATSDPRYRWERNKAVPRKIGSHLWLYDCINCDKCVPVCPNDANFVYETELAEIAYSNYLLTRDRIATPTLGGVFKVGKAHQLGNYADACNDCGNCDVFCPEDGGPYIEKPRLFGSLETYRKYAGRNGFYISYNGRSSAIYGTIRGRSYTLRLDPLADRASFDDGQAEVELMLSTDRILSWKLKAVSDAAAGSPGSDAAGHMLEMLPYYQLKLLIRAVSDPRHVHYANVAGLENPESNVAASAHAPAKQTR